MSADAWRFCPQCRKNIETKNKEAAKKVENLYGKVSSSEYLSKLKALNAPKDNPEESLREDYCVYMDESGVLHISYQASCEVCNFNHHYKYDNKVI